MMFISGITALLIQVHKLATVRLLFYLIGIQIILNGQGLKVAIIGVVSAGEISHAPQPGWRKSLVAWQAALRWIIQCLMPQPGTT